MAASDRRLCRVIAVVIVGLVVATACSDEAAIADLPDVVQLEGDILAEVDDDLPFELPTEDGDDA